MHGDFRRWTFDPEQGYRSCLALIKDAKRYSPERVEAACKRALPIGAPTRRSVVAILRNGLDQVPLEDEAPRPRTPRSATACVPGCCSSSVW